jgi:hypothetical protein
MENPKITYNLAKSRKITKLAQITFLKPNLGFYITHIVKAS